VVLSYIIILYIFHSTEYYCPFLALGAEKSFSSGNFIMFWEYYALQNALWAVMKHKYDNHTCSHKFMCTFQAFDAKKEPFIQSEINLY
jgi:hypothetical protein